MAVSSKLFVTLLQRLRRSKAHILPWDVNWKTHSQNFLLQLK